MSLTTNATVKGDKEVLRALKRLKRPAAAKRALRKGMNAGTSVLVKAVKARVRRGAGPVPGLLKKSIGKRVKTFRQAVAGFVGPRRGFLHILADGTRVDPVRYGHIEEYGRAAVSAKAGGVLANTKTVFGKKVAPYAGHPFLRPAWDEERGSIVATMGRETMAGVEKELAK